MNRRQFAAGGASSLSLLAFSGCTAVVSDTELKAPEPGAPQLYTVMYGPIPDERFPIPAVNLNRVPKKFWRRQVDFSGPYKVGTLVVDTRKFYLHLVQERGKAMRYGVGLGRAGFEWSGRGVIQWKQAWPKWTPPEEMIQREPELEKWSARNGGMPPGLDNPLGARALYIFQDGDDTLYRIHGSPEYWTIGKAVSSGCVRLMNQDIIDLYSRVPSGSTLVVI
ncbi:MAG: L,D-transpeptidase [Rhizobiaceae bacterium]|nr:L,D-transpeptidase [Rhizobiaceae bacterium]